MEKILDAGFCLPATCPLVPVRPRCLATGWDLHGRRVGFAFRTGGQGYWVFKGNYPYFVQHQASSIQYLVHFGINVSFQNFIFFGPGLSGLGISGVGVFF
jgi:hypothetical protein